MKKFKYNILKTVISMACLGIPVTKSYSQTVEVDKVTDDVVLSCGTSYKIPTDKDTKRYGAYVSSGLMSEYQFKNSEFNMCLSVAVNGGVEYLNSDKAKLGYDCGLGFKFGLGYNRIKLMAIKENSLSIVKGQNVEVMNTNGCGLCFRIMPYTQINADFLYSSITSNNKTDGKKSMVRFGVIYTLTRKINQK